MKSLSFKSILEGKFLSDIEQIFSSPMNFQKESIIKTNLLFV